MDSIEPITMTRKPRRRHSNRNGPTEREAGLGPSQETTPAEILELLGDKYTRAVLKAVLDRPRSGAEVADTADVSRATAFRRLNELVEFGLVTVQKRIDPNDGHHHKQYLAVIDGFSLTFGEHELEMQVETDGSHTRTRARTRVPAND